MITEDYVSFEVAKLLKEKGFDVNINTYRDDFIQRGSIVITLQECISKDKVKTPTLQMALKWLREEHNIFIAVEPHCFDGVKATEWIFNYWHNNCYYTPYDSKHPKYHPLFGKTWLSYEEACEAAIKYCLTNLI